MWRGLGRRRRTLQAGIYTYELTEEYLVENGISAEQAANESGKHQAILREDGSVHRLVDDREGVHGLVHVATYEEGDGSRVTFKWIGRVLRRLGDDVRRSRVTR